MKFIEILQNNGNISQMQWRTRGRERQGYRFTYDFLDRLTAANYYDVAETRWRSVCSLKNGNAGSTSPT